MNDTSSPRYCEWIKRDGNQTAIVFVHGLMGHYRKTWGRFPDLLTRDAEINHCDVICWGYPASPGIEVPFLTRRLPELEQVGHSLCTELSDLSPGSLYNDLILVGHSMGGLVIQKAILCALEQENHQLLQRIRHVLLYASPTLGTQVPQIARLHRQAWSLQKSSEFVKTLQERWKEASAKGTFSFGVTAILGLQDNAVPKESATAFWPKRQVQVIPGSHTEMCKPDAPEHPAYGMLKKILMTCTIPQFVTTDKDRDRLKEVNKRIVEEAQDEVFATGSRSRDPEYLATIESIVRARKNLKYYRVLMGPPHKQLLKEHLVKMLELQDSEGSSGGRRIHLSLYDRPRQPEIFICGNEKRCLVVLPGATGHIGEYSTAVVLTDPRFVRGYSDLVKSLHSAGIELTAREEVEALEVLELRRGGQPPKEPGAQLPLAPIPSPEPQVQYVH